MKEMQLRIIIMLHNDILHFPMLYKLHIRYQVEVYYLDSHSSTEVQYWVNNKKRKWKGEHEMDDDGNFFFRVSIRISRRVGAWACFSVLEFQLIYSGTRLCLEAVRNSAILLCLVVTQPF